MQFRKPPTHRIDAPIVFVHPGDSAWDTEAIEKSREEHGEDCPWSRYCSGATRYDIGPVTHLLSGKPVEFHLRRLDAIQLNDVTGLREREALQGFLYARAASMKGARLGLVSIEQDGRKLLELQRPADLTITDVQTITDSFDEGIEVLRLVGAAVFQASQPLRDDEKKH
ncbi:MAG: hypothetical protein AAFP15_12205 [Bacteroidota bacterium]